MKRKDWYVRRITNKILKNKQVVNTLEALNTRQTNYSIDWLQEVKIRFILLESGHFSSNEKRLNTIYINQVFVERFEEAGGDEQNRILLLVTVIVVHELGHLIIYHQGRLEEDKHPLNLETSIFGAGGVVKVYIVIMEKKKKWSRFTSLYGIGIENFLFSQEIINEIVDNEDFIPAFPLDVQENPNLPKGTKVFGMSQKENEHHIRFN